MKLYDWFKLYSQLGFHIFPVNKGTKLPAIKDNLKQATTDIKQMMAWDKQFCCPNWGLSLAKSGKVAVDIDVRNDGLKKWKRLVLKNSEPDTLKAVTPSNGLHYVFNSKPERSYRGKIESGIDVKHNGYILIEPSKREGSDKIYRWHENFGVLFTSDYPTWIAKLIEKPLKDEDDFAKVDSKNIELSELLPLIHKIQECELDYEEWVKVGMAIKSASPNKAGLELYLQATKNKSFKTGDLQMAAEKWKSFSRTNGDKVGLGTIIHILRTKGPESQCFKTDHQTIYKSKEKLVNDINSSGYFLLNEGQGEFIGQKAIGLFGEPKAHFFTPQRLKIQLAPMKLEVEGKKGETKLLDADQVWIGSNVRKSVKRIRFSPYSEENEFSLWHAPTLEPGYGDCTAILDILFKSLCNSDTETYQWVLNWLAHIVQKPAEKIYTVPVFISVEGTGKGILFELLMRKILGALFVKICDTTELTTRFNTHQMCRWLTFIDEATWDSTQRAASMLKTLTGSPTMTVEQKYGARFEVENYSRYAIATNNPDAVSISFDNRRFFIIEASEKYANNHDFFAPAIQGIQKGDLASDFYGFLLDRDLEKFNANEFPKKSDSGIAAKLRTEGIAAEFWHSVFFESPIKVCLSDNGIIANKVIQEFNSFQSNQKVKISPTEFWIRTKKIIPPLADCKTFDVRRNSFGKSRLYPISIYRAMSAFCERLRLSPPQSFDPKSYFYGDIGVSGFRSQAEI